MNKMSWHDEKSSVIAIFYDLRDVILYIAYVLQLSVIETRISNLSHKLGAKTAFLDKIHLVVILQTFTIVKMIDE